MPPQYEFVVYALVGALAQLIDGALGMAYGVTSSAMLLGLGMPPALASATVHYAETFTSGASGVSHLLAGNVRRRLFVTLAIPGVIGAVVGACLVSHLQTAWVKIALVPYLLLIGAFLLYRGARGRGHRTDIPRGTAPLGLLAGFLDAVGGGGWSAITVTQLVARGVTPRIVIGSAHLAKCVVSAAASISFLFMLGVEHSSAVIGLVIGGVLAAPFGALITRVMPARVATVLAGSTLLALGVNNAMVAFR